MPEFTHRIVLVGCGSMSRGWLSAVRDHYPDRVEVVGLVDLHEPAAAARAAEFALAGCRVGSSLAEVLRAARPDAVFNCTVPEAHAATCLLALEAGCHVLVEKPLAASVADGRLLAAAAARAGKTLAVIQNRRYLPGAVAVRDALAAGVIGRVNALHADFFLGPRFGGFREAMAHPLLQDMAIHTFDQARFLAGADARWVTCHEFNPPGSWFAAGASATAVFGMSGGVHFVYRGSWCARGFPTAWAGSWRVLGERGTLRWDGESHIEVERVRGPWDGREFIEPVETLTLAPAVLAEGRREHAGNLGEFLDALDAGTAPQTAAADNLRSLAMVEGALASARDGRTVALA
ncbi:MAG: Gfo/Idh/MocA family oxidoreductase [Caulobacteraceae bacterium]|nr:Gfo/Idh/MocA family oxidoreductase [Caulobacter sp.]